MDEHSTCYCVEISDLEELLSGYPLNERYFYENTVISPMDIVQRERLLKQILPDLDIGNPVQVDSLIFAYGEPEERHVTKIGGLPYWSKEKPWPIDSNGVKMEFMAQINFCNSLDIIPKIPSTLLSVFISGDGDSINEYKFEWQTVNPATELIDQSYLPEIEYPLVVSPVFGVNCRVYESDNAKPLNTIIHDDWKDITHIRGSKIGGKPRYFYEDSTSEMPGEYLCSLHSLRHPTNIPWTFINIEEPLTPEMIGGVGLHGGFGCHDSIMFGDQGTLFIFVEPDGTCHAELQCW